MAHPPIAIMSFNRPDYLREVLASLASQRGVDLDPTRIFLFQDNWKNKYSDRTCCTVEQVEDSVRAFKEVFPQGSVHLSPDNIGVCENFLRAEKFIFEEMRADLAYFLEDDLVIAPDYLRTMKTIGDWAADKPVGYFACYGSLTASENEQRSRARTIRRLGHHWAFGLFRRHWLAMQPLMQPYYDMVVGIDYRNRPNQKILSLFQEAGILARVSSQDDVKKAITYFLGTAAVNTNFVLGRYIGASGIHMNPAAFEKSGYARTVWLDDVPTGFDFPDAGQIKSMVDDELLSRRRDLERASQSAEAPPSPAAAPPAAPIAVQQTLPAKLGPPRMSSAERELFEKTLKAGRHRYAEFGMGGSTLMAAKQNFETLVCIDSDRNWVKAVQLHEDMAPLIANGRAALLHADIGPTKAWGNPADNSAMKRWPDYLGTMWAEWARRQQFPDLVFVDGRFRVSCALSTALLYLTRMNKSPPPLIMMHDLMEARRAYQKIFEFLHVEEHAESLYVMTPKATICPERLMAVLCKDMLEAI
jgi:hypothetical protein